MQSKKGFRKLNKSKNQRDLMLRNMFCSLIQYESIKTTQARAKALAVYTDKVITRAKKNDLAAKRYLRTLLPSFEAYRKVFEVLIERYKDVPGGYTVRVLDLNRPGDNSRMARVSLSHVEKLEEKIEEVVKVTKEKKPKLPSKKPEAKKVVSKAKPRKKKVTKEEEI